MATERPQFVLFGSSLVQYSYYAREGWGATISHLYSRKNDPVRPALVIVHFGSEDSTRPHSSGLGPHVPLQEYVGNMRKIADYLKALSWYTRLIFLSTPPVNEEKIPLDSDGKKPRTNELSRQYSDACLNICRDLDIVAIDLFSRIQKKDNWQDVCFIDGGVNLSAEGNIVVYEEILAALKRQEAWTPSVYWTMMLSEFREDSIYDPVNPDGETQSNSSDYAFPHPAKWGEPDYGIGNVTLQFI